MRLLAIACLLLACAGCAVPLSQRYPGDGKTPFLDTNGAPIHVHTNEVSQ